MPSRRISLLFLSILLLAGCGGGQLSPGGSASENSGLTLSNTPLLQLEVEVDQNVRAQGSQIELIRVELRALPSRGLIATQTVEAGQTVRFREVPLGLTSVEAQGLSAEGAPVGLPIRRQVELVRGATISLRLSLIPEEPNELQIQPSPVTIAVNSQLQLNALALFPSGGSATLLAANWSVDNPQIARIDEFGNLTGLNPGSTTARVSFGQLQAQAEVTVTLAPPLTLQVTPANATVAAGASVKFEAFADFGNGLQNVSNQVTWSTTNGLASIDNTGLATGLQPGQVFIAANLSGTGSQGLLTVTQAEPVELRLVPNPLTLGVAESQSLTATLLFSDGRQSPAQQVSFTSNVPTIATVDGNGNITGVAEGQAVITGTTPEGLQATVQVTVEGAALVALRLQPLTPNILVGDIFQMRAFGDFSDGSSRELTLDPGLVWASSRPGVASVDANGLATGLSEGFTDISATFGNVVGQTQMFVATFRPAALGRVYAGGTGVNLNRRIGLPSTLNQNDPPEQLGPQATELAIDPLRDRLFASNGGGTINVFEGASTGALTAARSFTSPDLPATDHVLATVPALDQVIAIGNDQVVFLPSNANGATPAIRDFTLTRDLGPTSVFSDLYYDQPHDRLYVIESTGTPPSKLQRYDNVSTIPDGSTGIPAASIDIAGAFLFTLAFDPGAGALYLNGTTAGDRLVYVFDDPGALTTGTVTTDRDIDLPDVGGIGGAFFTSNNQLVITRLNEVLVIANANTTNGTANIVGSYAGANVTNVGRAVVVDLTR